MCFVRVLRGLIMFVYTMISRFIIQWCLSVPMVICLTSDLQKLPSECPETGTEIFLNVGKPENNTKIYF